MSSSALHPNQFQVNEAWIAFRLNDAPVTTGTDGDFNVVALMDAASCFILGSTLVPLSAMEPSRLEAKRLLKNGREQLQEWPGTLFIPEDQPAKFLAVEAERQGITVIRVPEARLEPFTDEAREGFAERFGGGRKRRT